jgi:hypothetical protein
VRRLVFILESAAHFSHGGETMNQITKHGMKRALLLWLLAVASVTHAANGNDANSLDKGAVADLTPQQKYQSAIREAGGAYKEWLRECMPMTGADQRVCRQEAKAAYDADMAAAKRIFP